MATLSANKDAEGEEARGGIVGLLQFHVSPTKSVNLSRLPTLISTFLQSNPTTTLLVLPEIWNSPYAVDAFRDNAEPCPTPNPTSPTSPSIDPTTSPSVHLLQSLAVKHSVHICGGSIPEITTSGDIHNTALVFDPSGACIARHRKVHLFDIDIPNGVTFKESDTLTAGDSLLTTFNHPTLGVVGLGICYDIRFPELFLLHASTPSPIPTTPSGLDLFILPGAFNMSTGPKHWELLQRARAVDTQCYVVSASPARSNAVMAKEYKDVTKGKYGDRKSVV